MRLPKLSSEMDWSRPGQGGYVRLATLLFLCGMTKVGSREALSESVLPFNE